VDSVTLVTAIGVGAASAVAVGLFAHLVGYDRDKAFYPAVLTVVGCLYVLFAVMAGGGRRLVPEVVFFAAFAALAAAGFRTSAWIVAAGLGLHGVFDFVRHAFLPAPGAPEWWPAFCGSYDAVAGLGLAALLLTRNRRGSQTVDARDGQNAVTHPPHAPRPSHARLLHDPPASP
jgi:hypothetical protein